MSLQKQHQNTRNSTLKRQECKNRFTYSQEGIVLLGLTASHHNSFFLSSQRLRRDQIIVRFESSLDY